MMMRALSLFAIATAMTSTCLADDQASPPPTPPCIAELVSSGASAWKLGEVAYWHERRDFHLGHTVQLLRMGLPIGRARSCAPPAPSGPPRPQEQLSPADQMNRSFIAKQAAAEATNAVREGAQAALSRAPSAAAAVVGAPPASGADAGGARDFSTCARGALSLLKHRIALRAEILAGAAPNVEDATAAVDAIAASLQTQSGRNGLPCGAGVPALEAASIPGDAEAIKALLALMARPEGAERQRLAEALALASDASNRDEIRRAWRLVWNRLSLAAVFGSGALPTLAEIVAAADASAPPSAPAISIVPTGPELSSGGDETPQITIRPRVSLTYAGLAPLVEQGEAIAKEKYASR